MVSRDKSVSFLTDSITGVLKKSYDDKETMKEHMQKYEFAD